MSVVIFIVILAVLVFVHELGHFSVAKFFGIRVDEFGLGFPPRIIGIQKILPANSAAEKLTKVSSSVEQISITENGRTVTEEIIEQSVVTEAVKPKKWRFFKGNEPATEDGNTVYSINAIPFGGFVRIFGEDGNEDENGENKDKKPAKDNRSFINKKRPIQIAVLVAGVLSNFIFAWLLISLGFMTGLPAPIDSGLSGQVKDARLTITEVLPGSPAAKAGLKSGDIVLSITNGQKTLNQINVLPAQDFISSSAGELAINYSRGNEKGTIKVTPKEGIVAGKKAIGIGMEMVGVLKLPFFTALYEGAKTTYSLSYLTVTGLGTFVYQAFIGQAKLSEVSGPVGIAGIVGDAATLGFSYILSVAAFISINLAVINLVPFPALDGGRVLFVIIESIKRSPINQKITRTVNTVGFVLLIVLMIVVTYNDIVKLFI
ncbi:MAG: RIP metalloprotease RseP [Candidatus Paceibacterota bacterium]